MERVAQKKNIMTPSGYLMTDEGLRQKYNNISRIKKGFTYRNHDTSERARHEFNEKKRFGIIGKQINGQESI
jgi:hypothetical protein